MEMSTGKIAACAAVVWLLAGTVVVAAEDTEEAPEVTLAGDVFTKYVWRGQLLVDDWVAQPSASIAYKGFTASIWSNFCPTDEIDAENEFTEFDYSLDYSAAIPGQDLFSFSVGTIYYRFPNQPFDPTVEVYGGLSADLPLSPAVKAFYDVGDRIDDDEIEGTYIQFSLGHSIEKIQKWTEDCYCDLELGVSVGYATAGYNRGYFSVNDVPVDDAAFNDLTLSVGAPISLGNWTIKPQIGYATMLDSDIRAATEDSDNLFAGIGASFGF
jgi:hypothetical protein